MKAFIALLFFIFQLCLASTTRVRIQTPILYTDTGAVASHHSKYYNVDSDRAEYLRQHPLDGLTASSGLDEYNRHLITFLHGDGVFSNAEADAKADSTIQNLRGVRLPAGVI